MAIRSLPICAPTRIAEDGAVSAYKGRVFAVLLVGGSDSTAVELTNDANGAGTNVLHFKCVANDSRYFDFIEMGGVEFSSKCYADITGTGAVAFIWYA